MTPPFQTASGLAALAGISHGFFGREGGVSEGALAALNASFAVGDAPDRVASNRALIARALDFAPEALTTIRQVHSARAITLGPNDGRDLPAADAMVTREPGRLLGILTADCTPVLLADPAAGVVGAAHAGWRGAVDGIVEAVVAAMTAQGAVPERMVAAIGPTISAANYEVGPDFVRDLLARHPEAASRVSRPHGGREHFDLPGFVADRLRAAGVGQVDELAACTLAAPERYFSHRHATRAGTATGRQLSVIGLTR